MKPHNWRKYYSYRPQSLAELGRLSDTDIQRQERAYRSWLIASGKVVLSDREMATKIKEAQAELAGARATLEEAVKARDANPRSLTLRDACYYGDREWRRCEREVERVDDMRSDMLHDKARAYCAAMTRETLIASTAGHESKARQIETVDFAELSPRCIIRTMRCYSASAKEEWNPEKGRWEKFGGSSWRHGRLPKPESPTTYSVIVDGRCVNSFLSKARAKEWALAKLAA